MKNKLMKIGADTVESATTLPSSKHASLFLAAPSLKTGGLVLGDVALRSLLVGAGVYLAGERETARLAGYALAGSLAIEAFVLAWTRYQSRSAAPGADQSRSAAPGAEKG